MAESSSDRNVVERLAEEFVERYRRGERPPLSLYTDQYPQHAEEIRDLFPALLMMENLKPGSKDATGSFDGEPVKSESFPAQIGDYRIIREVGRGGMGIVYEAEQVSLGRHVALKVLPRQVLLDPRQKHRFEREAKAAARLHHTNIVPVFGVGEQEGMHYFVMQFIQGLGLDEVLEELKRQRGGKVGGKSAAGRDEASDAVRGDVSAAAVARSLVTGRFPGAVGVAETVTEAAGAERELDLAKAITTVGSDPTVPSSTPSSGVDRLKAVTTVAVTTGGSPSSDADRLKAIATLGSDASGRLTAGSSGSSSSVGLGGQSGGSHGSSGRRRSYWQSVANIGVQVAGALEYAHKQGILHRDVKPSNLLLDTVGTVWVTDFGLAKADDQQNLTHTGDIIGTLRYMAPEAFEGKSDARGDVYALGLTLYELLALQPAFDEKDRHKLIKQVTTEDPQPLDRLNREIPRDLATVIHKAIDREPVRRYQTAGEMSADLRRYLGDEPIRARRVTPLERLVRWSRRNRGLAASLGAMLLVLVAVAAGSSIAAARFRGIAAEKGNLAAETTRLAVEKETERAAAVAARNEADAGRRREAELKGQAQQALSRAEESAKQARRNLYFTEMNLAHQAWGDVLGVSRMRSLLDDWRGEDERLAVRGWEWYYLDALGRQDAATLTGHRNVVAALGYSPDGARLATGGNDGLLKIWDAANGRELISIAAHSRNVTAVAWRPTGGRVASIGQEGLIKVWHAETGRELFTLDSGTIDLLTLAWSRDGSLLAVGDQVGSIRLFNAETAEPVRTWTAHPEGTRTLSFHPDGTRLASMGMDGRIAVWDSATAGEIRSWSNDAWFPSIAYSPDGRYLAANSHDDLSVKLFDPETGSQVRRLTGHRGEVVSLAFNSSGTRLVSGSMDGTLKVWDVETGAARLTHRGHTMRLTAVAYSPDGNRLASSAYDRAVKLWDATRPQASHVLRGHTMWVKGISWSPDGRLLASSGEDRSIMLWDVRKRQPLTSLSGHFSSVTDVAFSPNGRLLASCDLRGMLILWDVATQRELAQVPIGRSLGVGWSPNGESLVVAGGLGDVGSLSIVGVVGGGAHRPLQGHGRTVIDASFSPDGRRLASASDDQTVRIWDASSLNLLATLRGHASGVAAVRWDPKGERLASAGHDATIKIWNADTYALVQTLEGHTEPLYSLDWTPDGRRLASAGMDGQIKVWDVATGQESLSLRTHDNQITRVAWGPDGTQLASGSYDETVQIYDAAPSYAREASPKLLAVLDRRIADDPSSAEDLLSRSDIYERLGRNDESHADAQSARAVYEQRLASTPDDATAAALAELLATRFDGWQVLSPIEVSSSGGATLTTLPDGSVLASGTNADRDVYTFAAEWREGITAIRLEAIPDPSLPLGGSGRHPNNGNFLLTEFRAGQVDPRGTETPLSIGEALCDFHKAGCEIELTLDGRTDSCWDPWPGHLERRTAAFAVHPLSAGPSSRLVVRLDFTDSAWTQHSLGRFRISVTSQARPLDSERLRHFVNKGRGPGRVRLAAAYASRGEWEAGLRALDSVAQGAGESGGDEPFLRPIILWALGKNEEARTALDEALSWASAHTVEDSLRPLALHAIRTVSRGDRETADALLAEREPAAELAMLVAEIESTPRNKLLLARRGRLLAAMGRDEDSTADFLAILNETRPGDELWYTDQSVETEVARWGAVFARVVEQRPEHRDLWIARGQYLARHAEWSEAAEAIERALALKPRDHMGLCKLASLRLQLGDVDGYREVCRRLLDEFSATQSRIEAERAAKTCLLLPDPAGDVAELRALAERSLDHTVGQVPPEWHPPWAHLVVGLAQIRDGQSAMAVGHLQQSVESNVTHRYLRPTALLVMALARAKLGERDPARLALAEADELYQRNCPKLESGDLAYDWHDWVMFQALRREVAAALEEPFLTPAPR